MAENSRRWAEISRRYRTYIKLEKRLSANTVESYMRDLEQFAHFVLRMWDVPPRKVESQMIERYMAWLYDRGCEKSSQARALSGLKSFFNYLLLTDAIESSPLEFIEMPKFSRRLPDVLSTAEIDRAVVEGKAAQQELQRLAEADRAFDCSFDMAVGYGLDAATDDERRADFRAVRGLE